jgi:hypothetical protein
MGRGLENLGKEYKNQIDKSFKFQTSQTVRGKVVRFHDAAFWVMDLDDILGFPANEIWWGHTEQSRSFFEEGRFLWSYVGVQGITSISANCDKF